MLHVKDDRHVGGRSSSKDVLSAKAQRKHGFRVGALPASFRTSFEHLYSEVNGQNRQDAFEECLWANTRTPVVDQVCFRLDVRHRTSANPELGVLYDAWGSSNRTGYSATVFLQSLLLLPATEAELLEGPREVFDSLAELLDAGWRVN